MRPVGFCPTLLLPTLRGFALILPPTRPGHQNLPAASPNLPAASPAVGLAPPASGLASSTSTPPAPLAASPSPSWPPRPTRRLPLHLLATSPLPPPPPRPSRHLPLHLLAPPAAPPLAASPPPPAASRLQSTSKVMSMSGSGKRGRYVRQVTGRHNDTDLHRCTWPEVAVATGEGGEELVAARRTVAAEANEVGETPLVAAAERGHLEVVVELLRYLDAEGVAAKNSNGRRAEGGAGGSRRHGEDSGQGHVPAQARTRRAETGHGRGGAQSSGRSGRGARGSAGGRRQQRSKPSEENRRERKKIGGRRRARGKNVLERRI